MNKLDADLYSIEFQKEENNDKAFISLSSKTQALHPYKTKCELEAYESIVFEKNNKRIS